VQVEWINPKPLDEAAAGDVAVSRLGTLAAAHVTPVSGEPFIAVSVYGAWEKAHSSSGNGFIYADASVHRLISDLSVFVGKGRRRNILVAGDLNILHGYGEHGDAYWARRYETVFSRMEALGFKFLGPQRPHGRQADPWPGELPPESGNVPTYYRRGQSPEACTRQLDFVFASGPIATRLSVRAHNAPDDWGPSDHCRVEIELI
jgi:hypothetical protein